MKDLVRISKFLSLVLRHQPQKIGLQLDENGWASVAELLEKTTIPLDIQTLKEVVSNNDKQRFAFSEDYQKIRADQGHSIEIDLQLKPQTPPEILFHGTATKNLQSIKRQGLVKGKRHHVHLSSDKETARRVGGRHGEAVVLTIRAGVMRRAGCLFYKSENGVWLTEEVAAGLIEFPV